MKVIEQTDEEIPVHIVSTVNADAAKIEEKLALEHRTAYRKRENFSKYLDFGLTVSGSKNSTKAVSQAMEIDSTDETGHLLSKYKGDDDQDEDKENADVSGHAIFRFQQSVKKSTNSMMKKAIVEEKQNETKVIKRVKQTKRGRKQTKEAVAPDYAKRRRIQRQMELLKGDQDDDEQDDDEIKESTSEEDDEEEQPKAVLDDDDDDDDNDDDVDDDELDTRRKKKSMFMETEGYERYFQDLHGTSKTSNNTLSKLPVLEPQEFHQILQDAPTKHAEEIAVLSEMHKQHYLQWYFELCSGFNLVFYGYGSKRNLLNEFAQTCLTDGPMIVVNGFFPSISIKDILLKITAGALGLTGPTGSIQDHVKFICSYFSDEDRDYESLYILIHNLDGANLRNERAQTALSMLASAKNIHLIASVDHINAGLLWDNAKSSQFNWIWHDATTYDDYLVETSFENTMLVRTGELGGARGAKYVLDSLTSNARGVFKVLAEHQLIEMELANMEGRGNESVGLTYGQYYQKCREGFYVSSDLALKSELTEFRDHKLISTKKNLDGTEIFFIPLDRSTLLFIIEQL
ncbi:MAG: origin recognition complex subunit 2-domain-containing protein [Benjaminiella poitrasii]|nr:MAG: origin recognition complex subunit 2-domain-containing protein [Benjaminiella poitrasii]